MRRALVVAAFLALGTPAVAQSGARSVPIERTVLDNGLEVVVSYDPSAPLVAVNLWYDVGSGHEAPGQFGFAHLLEHLAFAATENLDAGELRALVTGAGGALNGRTSTDRTEYSELVPAHHLERVIWSHAERMRRVQMTDAALRTQREFVREERRLGVENVPYGEAQLVLDTLAQVYAPYRHAVIGSMRDLDAASIDDVRGFYDRWYRPNNARLVVVGDATFAEVVRLAERHLSELERGPALAAMPPPPAEPRTDGPHRAEVPDARAELPLTYVAWSAPPAGHPDLPALEVASRILTAGGSARLAVRLVSEAGVASQVLGQVVSRSGPGLFVTGALVVPGVDPGAVEAGILSVVDRLAAEGPTASELERAVNQLRTARASEVQTAAGRAEAIQRAMALGADPAALLDGLDGLRGVTADDVREAVSTWLSEGNRNVVVAFPAAGRP